MSGYPRVKQPQTTAVVQQPIANGYQPPNGEGGYGQAQPQQVIYAQPQPVVYGQQQPQQVIYGQPQQIVYTNQPQGTYGQPQQAVVYQQPAQAFPPVQTTTVTQTAYPMAQKQTNRVPVVK